MTAPDDRLFTVRFFTMCGFTFTVFLSAFQLLPTAPFRILDLGGSKFAAGLFLGILTYASALSAPVTGALADRVGKRRVLIVTSLAIAACSVAYAVSRSYRVPLVLVFFHGLFWSGLLSASSAYMTDSIPESRRAEGIGYWGMSTMLAVAMAPTVGFWMYRRGWAWLCAESAALNLLMAGIAFSLPETDVAARLSRERFFGRHLVEWRVVAVALSLFVVSFGYGGVTSFVAVYAEENHIVPKGIFFTTFALVVIVTRLVSGRLADRVGHRRVLLPCLALAALGLLLLPLARTRTLMILAAFVFAVGFGNMYPAFVAHVVRHVDRSRRGAAFGGILAAFDTGIGTGSITIGALAQHFGFPPAFLVGGLLSALSIPIFLYTEGRFLIGAGAGVAPPSPASPVDSFRNE
jgi:MFS family permease